MIRFFFFQPKENKHFRENVTVTEEQIKLAPKGTFSLKLCKSMNLSTGAQETETAEGQLFRGRRSGTKNFQKTVRKKAGSLE